MNEVKIEICEDEFEAVETRVFLKPGIYINSVDITAFPVVPEAYIND